MKKQQTNKQTKPLPGVFKATVKKLSDRNVAWNSFSLTRHCMTEMWFRVPEFRVSLVSEIELFILKYALAKDHWDGSSTL